MLMFDTFLLVVCIASRHHEAEHVIGHSKKLSDRLAALSFVGKMQIW